LKSNLLTLPFATFNLGAEFTLAPKWTLSADVSLPITNIWGGYEYDALYNRQAQIEETPFYANGWMAILEGRYWFCEAFRGHHLGLYAGGARLGHLKIDNNIFGTFVTGTHTGMIEDGTAAMFGLSYGYYIKFYHGWGLDLSIGGGALYADFMPVGGTDYEDFFSFTLTRIGVSLSYVF
jgi:hypothetical protein